MRLVAPPIAAVVLLAALVSCRGHASADDCRSIADHYVDLAVRENPDSAHLSPAALAAVREVERGLQRARPGYRMVLDACGDVTTGQVACAHRAQTTREWDACLRPARRSPLTTRTRHGRS